MFEYPFVPVPNFLSVGDMLVTIGHVIFRQQ